MSSEISFSYTLRMSDLNKNYQQTRTEDREGTKKGPVPGAITVPTAGINIDLSQLTTPGWAVFINEDATNYVEWGIKEPATGFFYPIGEIGPGKEQPIFFSRNLLQEYTNTGTGTSAPTNYLHFKANTDSCNVSIEAYER